MPAASRSLVMLTPPVLTEQAPLALVSELIRVPNSTHCRRGSQPQVWGLAGMGLLLSRLQDARVQGACWWRGRPRCIRWRGMRAQLQRR